MTDIDYKKLKESTVSIIKKVEDFVSNIGIDKLTAIKKKLGLIKAIISDISKINECCRATEGIFDPLMMMMMMNTAKDGSPEAINDLMRTLQDKIKQFDSINPKKE